LLALEHPLINIIAIALITIGWSKHKNWWLVNQNLRLFYFFMDWDYYLYWVEFLGKSGCKDQKKLEIGLFIKVWFLLKQNRTKKLIMKNQ
jgi:hypothetical protein